MESRSRFSSIFDTIIISGSDIIATTQAYTEMSRPSLADIKVGGNVGEKADRHKLGGVEHEHGKGKPYKGQPSGKRFFVLHPKNKMYYLLSFLFTLQSYAINKV